MDFRIDEPYFLHDRSAFRKRFRGQFHKQMVKRSEDRFLSRFGKLDVIEFQRQIGQTDIDFTDGQLAIEFFGDEFPGLRFDKLWQEINTGSDQSE